MNQRCAALLQVNPFATCFGGHQESDALLVEVICRILLRLRTADLAAPRVTAVALAEDGLPVWIPAADPRWWAAHKLWLTREPGRDPVKRQRDRDQGRAVAQLLARAWGEADVSDEALASIPVPLRQQLRQALLEAREGADDEPEW